MSRPRITTHRSMLCSAGSKSAGAAVPPTEGSSLAPKKAAQSDDPVSLLTNSLFYPRPYENIEVEKKLKQTYGCSPKYQKRFLVDFFTALRKELHYIYVLLENLPYEYFVIERTYDRNLYWNSRNTTKEDGFLDPHERYSLTEFFKKKGQFHPIDDFEVVVLGQRFLQYSDQRPSQKELITLYLKFLREQCERHLRLNKPLAFTTEVIQKYGLTESDVHKIQPHIDRYNREARKKIWDEYHNLAQLDFIRLGPEKTNTK